MQFTVHHTWGRSYSRALPVSPLCLASTQISQRFPPLSICLASDQSVGGVTSLGTRLSYTSLLWFMPVFLATRNAYYENEFFVVYVARSQCLHVYTPLVHFLTLFACRSCVRRPLQIIWPSLVVHMCGVCGGVMWWERVGEEGTKMACVPTQIPRMNKLLFLYQLPVFLVAM